VNDIHHLDPGAYKMWQDDRRLPSFDELAVVLFPHERPESSFEVLFELARSLLCSRGMKDHVMNMQRRLNSKRNLLSALLFTVSVISSAGIAWADNPRQQMRADQREAVIDGVASRGGLSASLTVEGIRGDRVGPLREAELKVTLPASAFIPGATKFPAWLQRQIRGVDLLGGGITTASKAKVTVNPQTGIEQLEIIPPSKAAWGARQILEVAQARVRLRFIDGSSRTLPLSIGSHAQTAVPASYRDSDPLAKKISDMHLSNVEGHLVVAPQRQESIVHMMTKTGRSENARVKFPLARLFPGLKGRELVEAGKRLASIEFSPEFSGTMTTSAKLRVVGKGARKTVVFDIPKGRVSASRVTARDLPLIVTLKDGMRFRVRFRPANILRDDTKSMRRIHREQIAWNLADIRRNDEVIAKLGKVLHAHKNAGEPLVALTLGETKWGDPLWGPKTRYVGVSKIEQNLKGAGVQTERIEDIVESVEKRLQMTKRPMIVKLSVEKNAWGSSADWVSVLEKSKRDRSHERSAGRKEIRRRKRLMQKRSRVVIRSRRR
jgi:hypothetical protein